MQTKFSRSIGPTCRGGETFARFHRNPHHRGSVQIGETSGASMSSAGASPARTSATPERGQDSQASDQDCFSKSFVSLARWDQESLCWRTWQRCLLEGWETFSGRWPRSGTMRNGIAYRLPPLVPRISGTGCSLLPTPITWDAITSGFSQERIDEARKDRKDSLTRAIGGQLNPTWVEWLMGFPLGWTGLEDSETP